MNRISYPSFCGHSSESSGSIGYDNNRMTQNKQYGISFQAKEDKFESNKSTKAIGVIGGLTLLTAASIVGLGYAHKTNILSKMKDGKFKDMLKKAEPAAKKCHEWCATVKTKGQEVWNKIQNVFKS